ncbi:hypothetical protein BJX65DRAFT_260523 [Aspergillus insuetus]
MTRPSTVDLHIQRPRFSPLGKIRVFHPHSTPDSLSFSPQMTVIWRDPLLAGYLRPACPDAWGMNTPVPTH